MNEYKNAKSINQFIDPDKNVKSANQPIGLETKKIINPLYQRTEDDHAAHLKRWGDFGLLNPDIMDELIRLDDDELGALRSILFDDQNLVTLNDLLGKLKIFLSFLNGEIDDDKFTIIKGIVNDEIEISFDEDNCE